MPKANHRKLHILFILSILFISDRSYAQNANPNTYASLIHNVEFQNSISERVRSCFIEVLSQYSSLHDYEIKVKQKSIKSSTMQAQPVFTLECMLSKAKKFKIRLNKYVLDSDEVAIKDLPEDVLKGWFAHELGHLVDYETYSTGQMIWYGLKYVFSGNFRKKVEYAADYIAINEGFYDEIIATKKYILENDFFSESYQNKIRKFYLLEEEAASYAGDHPVHTIDSM